MKLWVRHRLYRQWQPGPCRILWLPLWAYLLFSLPGLQLHYLPASPGTFQPGMLNHMRGCWNFSSLLHPEGPIRQEQRTLLHHSGCPRLWYMILRFRQPSRYGRYEWPSALVQYGIHLPWAIPSCCHLVRSRWNLRQKIFLLSDYHDVSRSPLYIVDHYGQRGLTRTGRLFQRSSARNVLCLRNGILLTEHADVQYSPVRNDHVMQYNRHLEEYKLRESQYRYLLLPEYSPLLYPVLYQTVL